MRILLSILFVAMVATVADYTWYTLDVEHRMMTGIVHGVVLLTAVGGVLGWAAGRLAVGLPLGMAAGAGGAVAYYALAPVMGGLGAMVAAWASLWVLLAFFDGRILRRGRTGLPGILIRGMVAAVLGGLAFYLAVDTLWGRPPEGGRNYVIQLAAWTFAWAPGLAIVMIRKS